MRHYEAAIREETKGGPEWYRGQGRKGRDNDALKDELALQMVGLSASHALIGPRQGVKPQY